MEVRHHVPKRAQDTSQTGNQVLAPSQEDAAAKGSGEEAEEEVTVVSDEAAYICDACGEEIVVPLDLSQGSIQEYVEDCPVCCRANVVHVEINDDGTAMLRAEPE